MPPPKRVADRLAKSVCKFQKVLQIAKDKDVNESDTVSIIKDMLADIFGYDKYLEVTSELAIRGTFCDLAIKVDNKIEFLIEAKAIGMDLKESHLRQAINYGANNGVQWIILTNGILWKVYKIRFQKPIDYDLVCSFDFSEIDGNSEEHQEKLFVICKEGINKDAREALHEKIQCLNCFTLGALILSDEVVTVIRRELRKLPNGVLLAPEEIIKVLENEVLKRDVIEGEDAQKAKKSVKKYCSKVAKETCEKTETEPVPAPSEAPKTEISSSDQPLQVAQEQVKTTGAI